MSGCEPAGYVSRGLSVLAGWLTPLMLVVNRLRAMQKHTVIWVLAVLVSLLCGCQSDIAAAHAKRSALPADTMKILGKGDGFVFFSLDPTLPSIFGEPTSASETFHGHRILGKIELRGRERTNLLRELYAGIEQAGSDVPKCFNPRHGIRATLHDSTVELLICFECYQIRIFPERGHDILTARFPQSAFNRALERARVPIASYGSTNRPANRFE